MYEFLTGVLTMGYVIAGMIFGKHWRSTRDRLFAWFALAFCILALQQIALITTHPRHIIGAEEHDIAFYMMRLAAFVVILAAIVGKNSQRADYSVSALLHQYWD